MHASSLENMRRCYQRFVRGSPLHSCEDAIILDVGGADVNGGYREVFTNPRHRYLTADINASAGVDILLEDAYRIPLDDASVDIVLSGQMLEHCEFFWLSFAEMVRVLKPDGYLFLIAPSAGPIHRFPVDCYRFYPDGFRALAKYANCCLIDVWLDERGPWRDLVGVFCKHKLPILKPVTFPHDDPPPFDPVESPPGSAEEEAVRGSMHYLDALRLLHEKLAPSLYFEIGIRQGRSLKLAQCPAIGVDPKPDIRDSLLKETTHVIAKTSDDYFAEMSEHVLPQPPDLVFIDGMHLFEFALRDFMNVERLAGPGTLVVIDDIFPTHPVQARRRRCTRVWTGDIWKLHQLLTEVRKDLFLLALDTAPSGLLLVAGLDPSNRIFWENYNSIVRQYSTEVDPPGDVLLRINTMEPTNPALLKVLSAIAQARTSPATGLTETLRNAIATSPSAA